MAALQIVQTNLCILILGYTILFLTFYYLLGQVGNVVFVYVWKLGILYQKQILIFSSSSRGKFTFFNILLFVRWVMFCVCMEILYQEQIFIFSPSRGKSTSRYIINDFPKDRKRKSILHYTFKIFGFESAGQKMLSSTPVFKFRKSKWYMFQLI